MRESLYLWYRGASGFALIMAGLSVILEKGGIPSNRFAGVIFLSTGFLFSLSALDPLVPIHIDLSNFLVIGAIFALSQGLMELTVFLFGEDQNRKKIGRVYAVGAGWSLILFAAPLLETALGSARTRINVEDGRALGLIHFIAAYLVYAWPLAVTAFSLFLIRGKFGDTAVGQRAVTGLAGALAILIGILALAAAGGMAHSAGIYRLSHVLLQTYLLIWFLFQRRYPDYCLQIRKEIEEGRGRSLKLTEGDIESIRKKLSSAELDGTLFDERVDISFLAKRLGIKPFKLSAYLNQEKGKSFPDWLNGFRIQRVCALMAQEPGRKILEIAFQCGYSSKTTFNTHFLRVMGMSPSIYRKKVLIQKTER